MGLNPLNKVAYTAFDFDTSVDDLLTRLQVEYGADFSDFVRSSLGLLLLDLEAYGIDNMSFFIDRRASDSYLATARTKKAVGLLARQLGYKPRSAVASTVDIDLAPSQTYPFAVTVPRGHTFPAGDLTFQTAEEVTFLAGDGPSDIQTVACYEGHTVSETFTSNGQPNQIFELRLIPEGNYALQNTFEVTADGALYDEVDFLKFGKTNQVEIDYLNGTVRFGDGQVGNVPSAGSTILVEYSVTTGKAGQIAANSITTIDQLVVFFTSIDFNVSQPDKSSPGDDPESLESIKAGAGKLFKARGVAVTAQDYEAISSRYADPLFGRVAVAKAFCARTSEEDLELKTQLQLVTASGTELRDTVSDAADNINTATAAQTTALTTITSTLATAGTNIEDANDALTTALDLVREVRGSSLEVDNNADTITDIVTDASAAISAISTAGSSQLTAGDKTALLDYLALISARASSISSLATGQTSNSNDASSNITNASEKLVSVGTSPTSGYLNQITTQISSLTTQVSTINTQVALIDASVAEDQTEVQDALDTIDAHVHNILAADCKANLITVPILARDAAGFYIAPSNGLIASLRAHLNERKDVAHSVSVVSGAPFLVPAVLTVRLGIFPGVSPTVITSTANSIIDATLKGRKFGANLYVGTLITKLENLPGVVFANVTINGFDDGTTTDPGKNDVNGNLIIEESEVITKGSVVINVEVVEGQEG